MSQLLPKLLQRSAFLAVEDGRIILTPKSGLQNESDIWLKAHHEEVMEEILKATKRVGFTYIGYSTGYYNGANKSGGITLQFIQCVTAESFHVIYNVELKRKRNTSAGKAGERLPKGRFIAAKGSSFVKLWKSTGFRMPKLSAFHDCIGKLSKLTFTADTNDNRLLKQTLKPLNISFQEIAASVSVGHLNPDKNPTLSRQQPDNNLTKFSDKKTATTHKTQGSQATLSACTVNHGIKVNSMTDIRSEAYTIEQVNQQSIDEWLSDYNNGTR
ncbi:hypothetical protein [Neptunomonas sp.]|uniref:hypothetical protein n=1 Tax=Neptunomonas TaxID=75687 RepID=UPI00351984DB